MRSRSLATIGVIAIAVTLTLSSCAAAATTATTTAGCTPKTHVTTVQKGVLTVALTNTPPYSQETNGKIAGVDGDVATQFAAQECLKISFAPYTYATAVPAVQQGKVDLAVGGFYRSAARAAVVTLSDPQYLDQLAVYSPQGYSTVDQLVGKTIGTVTGYMWVAELQALPGTTVRTYPDSVSLAQDLKAGRIQAALDGAGSAAGAAKTAGLTDKVIALAPDPRVKETSNAAQTAILFNPANKGLSDGFNSFSATLHSSGAFTKILVKYGFPASAAKVGAPAPLS